MIGVFREEQKARMSETLSHTMGEGIDSLRLRRGLWLLLALVGLYLIGSYQDRQANRICPLPQDCSACPSRSR